MRTILVADHVLLPTGADPAFAPGEASGLLVEGARIAAIDTPERLAAHAPEARRIDLAGTALLPGLVNAHQHGRGISQIQLGYPDDILEPWMNQRRRRGPLDVRALVRACAAQMIENGITTTTHANFPFGSGDYEAEVEAALGAYDEAGLRVTFCVGAQDRGALLYPGADEAAFRAGLAPEVREVLAAPAPPPYVGDAAATIALMDRLLARWGDHPRITLAYGPAGPLWVGEGMLGALAADAARRGLGLHLHVLESRAQADAAARLFPEGTAAWLAAQGALGPNVTLAHCVYLTGDDIAAIADAGARIAHNPGSNLRLHNGAAPVPDFVAAGIEVGIGTDNTALADDEDLLGEMRLAGALARATRGEPRHDVGPATLLRMATEWGARSAFLEDVGTIAVGAKADLVAIDLGRTTRPMLDPDQTLLNAFTARARGADVRLTMIDGAILYEGGRHTRLDPQTEIEAAVSGARAARLSPRPAAAGATLPLREAVRDAYGLPRAPRHRDWA